MCSLLFLNGLVNAPRYLFASRFAAHDATRRGGGVYFRSQELSRYGGENVNFDGGFVIFPSAIFRSPRAVTA